MVGIDSGIVNPFRREHGRHFIEAHIRIVCDLEAGFCPRRDRDIVTNLTY